MQTFYLRYTERGAGTIFVFVVNYYLGGRVMWWGTYCISVLVKCAVCLSVLLARRITIV